jgi:hypothetical protein
MKTTIRKNLIAAVLFAVLACATSQAQTLTKTTSDTPTALAIGPQAGFRVLAGRWVRPDGGYVISIKAVDAGGELDASYANPSPLPFSIAKATRDGSELKLFFELRAGGYNGSTYTLTYDAASDQLKGVYYQAVARQRFEVVFDRK